MKQLYVFVLFLAYSLVLSPAAFPQTAPADSLFLQQTVANISQAYQKATAENLHLYNGSEYLRGGHGVKGFPFFLSGEMLKGDVWYDGCLYAGVRMQYDVVEDNLVISDYTDNVYIRLVKDKIRYFIIDGHRFEHIKTGEGLPGAGFYENLYSGRLSAYARRRKSVSGAATNMASYASYDSWLIEKDGVFFPVENERSAMAVLADKKDLLKKYIRSARLDFKKDPAGFLAGLLACYDRLNH